MKKQNSVTAFIPCELGAIAIAGDEAHVASIVFVSAEEAAALAGGATAIGAVAEAKRQLEQYLAGERTAFDFPMRPAGTPFQQRVWRELLSIPCGKTVAYLDIARAIGNPKGVRAVGQAIGRNPLSIVVPCHRVVGSSGKLTGYAGELWRKEWLLSHENRLAADHRAV